MLKPDLRLEWLVSFLAVVDTGSFVAAAEATHRSQPRVSMHVSSLERDVGVPLFDRTRRPVGLTEAGADFVRHARHILRELEAAEIAMTGWRNGARGIVHLGSHPSASASFVPSLLVGAARATPDVQVALVERSTLELDEALRAGEVDLYLRPMVPPPTTVDIVSTPLWHEPLVVVVPVGHILAELSSLTVQDIAAYPLLSIGQLHSDGGAFSESHELFRSEGLELTPVQATNQPQTLVAMVRAGLGVGVTNGLAMWTTDLSGVEIRRIGRGDERMVAVCRQAGRPLSPAAEVILRRIIAHDPPEGTLPAQVEEARYSSSG